MMPSMMMNAGPYARNSVPQNSNADIALFYFVTMVPYICANTTEISSGAPWVVGGPALSTLLTQVSSQETG